MLASCFTAPNAPAPLCVHSVMLVTFSVVDLAKIAKLLPTVATPALLMAQTSSAPPVPILSIPPLMQLAPAHARMAPTNRVIKPMQLVSLAPPSTPTAPSAAAPVPVIPAQLPISWALIKNARPAPVSLTAQTTAKQGMTPMDTVTPASIPSSPQMESVVAMLILLFQPALDNVLFVQAPMELSVKFAPLLSVQPAPPDHSKDPTENAKNALAP